VNYLADDSLTTWENNQNKISVDSTNKVGAKENGRGSIRLESKKTYTHGLFIIDMGHMPEGVCVSHAFG